MPDDGYYILDLDTLYGMLLWWGPDDSGFVANLDNAGVYTRQQIEKDPGRNDGSLTRAIPVAEARKLAATVVSAEHRKQLLKRAMPRKRKGKK